MGHAFQQFDGQLEAGHWRVAFADLPGSDASVCRATLEAVWSGGLGLRSLAAIPSPRARQCPEWPEWSGADEEEWPEWSESQPVTARTPTLTTAIKTIIRSPRSTNTSLVGIDRTNRDSRGKSTRPDIQTERGRQ
jgi:hypothetical protein